MRLPHIQANRSHPIIRKSQSGVVMAQQKLVRAPFYVVELRNLKLEQAAVIRALLLVGLLIGACGPQDDRASGEPVIISRTRAAMVLAPGWVTGSTWPTETVVALNSVAARSTSRVDGSVGVILSGTGSFLDGSSELGLEANAEITGDIRADSVNTVATSHVLGNAAYNLFLGTGTVDGTRTSSLALPLPITVVATANFSAGTTNNTYNASTISSLTAGSYGTITLNAGAPTAPTVLRLSAGTYYVSSIVVGNYARFECASTSSAPCTIAVKGRVSLGNWSYFGPGSASSTSLVMGKINLFVEGTNGSDGPLGTPAALSTGQRSELHAYTFVPNGTLRFGSTNSGVGKFIAKDVDIGADTELMTGTTSQQVLLNRFVVGPTWPREILTALNSIYIMSNTSLTGDALVIQNGAGSFLSTSEAVLDANATLTGNLKADKIELKAGAKITKTASYNTLVNAGTVGSTITPLVIPVDVSAPVFPVVKAGSSSKTIAAKTDQTLAAGSYRDLTLNAGLTTDYTELRLTGGLYQFRKITLGTYSKLICDAACEIRVSRNIAAGDFTEVGPDAGLDPAQVKAFVYGLNNNKTGSGPSTTSFAVSFGQNSKASGLFYAPRGTLEGKTGATLSGRFIARDIKLGSSSVSVVAGTTELAPAIQTQPEDVEIVQGQPAAFSVEATGTDVTLQWKRNNVIIAGATSGSYTLPTTVPADSGALFTVVVSNSLGSLTSSAALLTVNICDPDTYVPTVTTCGIGGCARTGMLTCPDGAVVNTCSAGTPAANDASCNGIDDNCNGRVDEGYVPTATSCGPGLCPATGQLTCVAGTVKDSCATATSVPTTDTTCDGRDDNCNGQIDEGYVNVASTCGVGSCRRSGVATCVGGAIQDSCVEGAPGSSDANCNGIDEDCDGEADQDYDAVLTSCGAGVCKASGETDCVGGVVVDSCRAGSTSNTTDTTCDGVDDNCNGQIDEGYVAVATSCGIGPCGRTGTRTCVSGVLQDSCRPGTPAATDTTCNGIDDNCNGTKDEGYLVTTSSCGVGACVRSGNNTCVNGSVVNSCTPGAPGPSDTTCNGIDDNCNGTKDEGYPVSSTSCGVGACAASGVMSCVGGTVKNSCVAGTGAANDTTCNGIDDNCNSQVDEGYVPVVTHCGSGGCATTGMTSCVTGALANSCAPSTTDTDSDGLADCTDLCPLDPLNDEDGDGYCANADNCPTVFNPDQVDTDGDHAGDACDAPVMIMVAAGGDHSCAVFQDRVVRCWGSNLDGQLGNGANMTVASLVPVTGVLDALEIVAGKSHTCARRTGGTVSCWGANAKGQLGNGSTTRSNTPVAVSGVSGALQLATGDTHSCALLASSVVCWGDNAYGQLGNGTIVSSYAPVAVTGLTDAVQITAGYGHTCAVRATGAVTCWGYNNDGELGNGTIVSASLPVAVTGVSDAQQVAAGTLHTCALRSNGATTCWGANIYGQLGNGTLADSRTPVAVAGPNDSVLLVAGMLHTCTMGATGTVRCWGYNSYGSIGQGTWTDVKTPNDVSGLTNATQLAAGSLHTCAVRTTGQVSCWGNGEQGQLGQGMLQIAKVPAVVVGVAGAVAVASGAYNTCALQGAGTVLCWGPNGAGELGDGTLLDSSSPVEVSGISNATAIAAGDSHACALLSSGTVRCWGTGGDGQLGDGRAVNTKTPVTVSELSTAIGISTGADHTCAVLADGSVRCWGYGVDGELGNGGTTSTSTPVAVSGISDAIGVAAGVSHTCALSRGGSVRCWGLGLWGRLGNGTTTNALTPVVVSDLADAVYIAAGDEHTCAVRATSEVRCWGSNVSGQVGPLAPQRSLTPQVVAGLSGAQTVSAGGAHSCATLANGQIRCWGNNREGELGNGTTTNPPGTTLASGIADAVSVSAGLVHTCAVTALGTVSCWGDGDGGRLGNAYPWSNIPVRVIWP